MTLRNIRYGEVKRNGVRPVIWTTQQLRFIKRKYQAGWTLRRIAEYFGFDTHSRITVVCKEHRWLREKKNSDSAVFRSFMKRNAVRYIKMYQSDGISAAMVAEQIAKDCGLPYRSSIHPDIVNKWLIKKNAQKPFSKCALSKKSLIARNKWRHNRLTVHLSSKCKSYQQYLYVVRRSTRMIIDRFKNILHDLKFAYYGLEVDHRISIRYGWEHRIPIKIMSHPCNLQTMLGITNRQKGNKCDITLNKLKRDIRNFTKKHGDAFNFIRG